MVRLRNDSGVGGWREELAHVLVRHLDILGRVILEIVDTKLETKAT
jgi:hypothetical protein